ncbi:MAG TPA: DUF222 domain-containing protein [Streptosporangiaceae bacterium]
MCGRAQRDAPPANAGQALSALHEAMTFLATTDMTALSAAEQADCLRGLERAESARIAAQASALAAFDAKQGYADDGHGSSRTWLRWQTRITGHAASAAVGWTRRLAGHRAVRDALAGGRISASWARQICDWTDLLPESARQDADDILLTAAAAGADLQDLAGLAEEMRARTASPDSDGGDDGAGRSLRLDLHYRGAGRLRGDLTPRCAAALREVLEALGKKAGPEDTRNRQQRYHDALEEACHRLIAARNLPQRAGQPTEIQLHMTLKDLFNAAGYGRGTGRDGGWPGTDGRNGPTLSGWLRPDRDDALRRLFPARDDLTREQPGAWTGPGPMATPGDLCDAKIVPVVTGHVDHKLLDELANSLLGHIASSAGQQHSAQQSRATGLAADFARNLILSNAVALLSGPGGLASRLRTGLLTGPAASISLPLDVGAATETIPRHLRRAVILRDNHCSFAGCTDTDCQVHHIIPISEGGKTCLENLTLGCRFHHLIAIHTWGWKVVLNADGTKTTISPDGSRVLHSHDPPGTRAA